MVSFFGTETSPSSGASSPTTMRNRVVLPAPFGPTRPTFSPGFNWKEASTKINCRPYCLLIFEKEIIRFFAKYSTPIHESAFMVPQGIRKPSTGHKRTIGNAQDGGRAESKKKLPSTSTK
jgi:hypothetical protein